MRNQENGKGVPTLPALAIPKSTSCLWECMKKAQFLYTKCRIDSIITLGMHEGAAAPSYLIRRTGFAGSRRSQNDSFLYHFPAVMQSITGK